MTPNQFGEYLFSDLLQVPILSVTEDRYLPAIQEFLAQQEAFIAVLTSILCDTGTEVQTGFLSGVGGQMQKMTKHGSVEATRGGQRWWTAYPLFAFGNRQLYEVPWLKRATFVELGATIYAAVLADINTTLSEMITALLNNVNTTYDDSQWPGMNAQQTGQAAGPLTIRRLANNDGAIGSVYARGQEIQLGTLNNYLVSGAANAAIGAFRLARAQLRTVGHDKDIVYGVSRATADYVADNFASTDFTQPVEILDTQYSQDIFTRYAKESPYGILGAGIRSRGRVAYGELVEFPSPFPDNYIFAWDRSQPPPLRRRISDLPDEQGLHLASPDGDIPDVQTHPLAKKEWRRLQGFGARNRANGVVVQITTSGSYTAPTL